MYLHTIYQAFVTQVNTPHATIKCVQRQLVRHASPIRCADRVRPAYTTPLFIDHCKISYRCPNRMAPYTMSHIACEQLLLIVNSMLFKNFSWIANNSRDATSGSIYLTSCIQYNKYLRLYYLRIFILYLEM